MIKSIVEYVNFYFTTYKTQFYSDNFIKACLVYQFLYAKYFTQKLDIDQIIYRLTEARHYLNSNSNIYREPGGGKLIDCPCVKTSAALIQIKISSLV